MNTYERLDRALFNEKQGTQFSDAQVKVLARVDFSGIIESLYKENYQRLYIIDIDTEIWRQIRVSFPYLDSNIKQRLNEDLKETDIKKALYDMAPWKSSGPDGFPSGFYQNLWSIIRKDVCTFIKKLWDKPSDIFEVNYIDLCLIPKVQSPKIVNHFRLLCSITSSIRSLVK